MNAIQPEAQCIDWLTGRKVWLIRHVPSGKPRGEFDWVATVVRRHWFDDQAEVRGLCGHGMHSRALDGLVKYLKHDMGFVRVRGNRRGTWRYY